ncbi:SGNH/GDSL hydrolase family protein [Bacteroides pyogenes]|uniref:SGNH/GDSL hydrolase family protein n=1 Tax=Bacteroides pyogenes TaxID=310300 RepID=UPI003F9FB07A
MLFCFCFLPSEAAAQDPLPQIAASEHPLKNMKPLREIMDREALKVPVQVMFPAAFRGTGHNEIADSLALLSPFLERLRQVHLGLSEDTVRIVHIGDSHVRGHIYPQTAGARLAETFGAVSYVDMGVNGATSLTFTHPVRIADIAALRPELLIVSFGTNESHNRRYNANVHYRQMDELMQLLRRSLPDVPFLLTTPPGSYDSFRKKRRKRTYAINPRTAIAAETIRRYAGDHQVLLWDMYEVVGGRRRACLNWTEANMMHFDHVHYLPEGYVLQGDLLFQAIIRAYNDYVSN